MKFDLNDLHGRLWMGIQNLKAKAIPIEDGGAIAHEFGLFRFTDTHPYCQGQEFNGYMLNLPVASNHHAPTENEEPLRWTLFHYGSLGEGIHAVVPPGGTEKVGWRDLNDIHRAVLDQAVNQWLEEHVPELYEIHSEQQALDERAMELSHGLLDVLTVYPRYSKAEVELLEMVNSYFSVIESGRKEVLIKMAATALKLIK